LEKKKTLLYVLSLIAFIAIIVWVYDELLHNIIHDELREYFEKREATRKLNPDRNLPGDFRSRPKHGWLITGRYLSNAFFIFISLLISTIYHYTLANKRREQEHIQIKNQMLEAESKMLKWQINPHFLFNTLNNIYSMSQLKSDKTPDAVHRLSEMLRYVIYECNDDFVKLKQEVKYIQSYIDLILLKDENLQNVKYNFAGINPELKITPMILIPFIENSFKHSKFEDSEKSWINIELKTTGNQLNFKIENSVPDNNFTKDKVGGIGIANVKKRLHMLYQGKHSLNLKEENDIYSVELMMKLNDN